MTASTTTHTWMMGGMLRIPTSSGLPLAPPKASPCVLGLLDHTHPQAHAAMKAVI